MTDKAVVSDVIQEFYDGIAPQYDKLYLDWEKTVRDEAAFLGELFEACGLGTGARVLDCACGIGTQAIGLALLGYGVTAADISAGEIAEARRRAGEVGASIRFERADFRRLEDAFSEKFDVVVAMDNALPHMLTAVDLETAVKSISGRVAEGGVFVASIRDYDSLLESRPAYSPPYVHKTETGQRVLFQTWDWEGDNYRFVQYVIDDDGARATTSRHACEYRAVRRAELTRLLESCGFVGVSWKMPEETGFYQPIVIARR